MDLRNRHSDNSISQVALALIKLREKPKFFSDQLRLRLSVDKAKENTHHPDTYTSGKQNSKHSTPHEQLLSGE